MKSLNKNLYPSPDLLKVKKKTFFLLAVILCAFSLNAKTIYCSSSTGSDSNSGTILSPVSTISKAMDLSTANSTILLKCGDVFFENINCYGKQLNISSYADGEKPMICGLKIPTSKSKWQIVRNNIWCMQLNLGAEYFDGFQVKQSHYYENDIGAIVNLATGSLNECRSVPSIDSLEVNFDFCQAFDTIGPRSDDYDNIYLYYEGNPNDLQLAFTCGSNGVYNAENCTFNNLHVCYWGCHGFSIMSNVTVENCRIDAIGGSIQNPTVADRWVLFGNGIESYVKPPGRENITVRSCEVSRCFDAGLTIQGASEKGLYAKNIEFSNNLVYNCCQGWEGVLRYKLDEEQTIGPTFLPNGDTKDIDRDFQYSVPEGYGFINSVLKNNMFYANGVNTGFRYFDKRYKRCQLLSNSRRPEKLLITDNFFFDGNFQCLTIVYNGPTPYENVYRNPHVLENNITVIRVGQDLVGDYVGKNGVVKINSYADATTAIAAYREETNDRSTEFVVMDTYSFPSLDIIRAIFHNSQVNGYVRTIFKY